VPNPKKPRTPCLWCGKEPARSYYKYCSNKCQGLYQRDQVLKEWKIGKRSGLNNIGLVTRAIKAYLREKYENKCCLCGWNRINQKTGLVPLVADHIDGNWRNNTENNLRLICPNCDSLNPTYAGSNKGNGGRKRLPSKRVLSAKIYKMD
jgi:hypothetical protein